MYKNYYEREDLDRHIDPVRKALLEVVLNDVPPIGEILSHDKPSLHYNDYESRIGDTVVFWRESRQPVRDPYFDKPPWVVVFSVDALLDGTLSKRKKVFSVKELTIHPGPWWDYILKELPKIIKESSRPDETMWLRNHPSTV